MVFNMLKRCFLRCLKNGFKMLTDVFLDAAYETILKMNNRMKLDWKRTDFTLVERKKRVK